MSVSEAMSEASEEVGSDTKRIINPRVEIDTSPPFVSVQEAVTHFGGSGSWIPLHLLRLAPPPPPRPHDQLRTEYLDMEKKINEQAAELERYLVSRERETLAVLKQLEETKRFVEDVKLKLSEQSLNSLHDRPSPGLILMELNQAKLNLNKTTDDLALLRASVDSLSQNVTKKGKSNSDMRVIREPQPPKISSNEQVKNMAEAARYEVMKAMAEIEQTKTSITVVEMRLVAARKMEEAAKAVEAIACAETTNKIMGFPRKVDEGYVSLPIEEYSLLTQKAREAEEVRLRRKSDEDLHQAFRSMKETESNFSRSTISMGDVLNQKKKKKLIVQDDMVVEKHIQQVSLSQMLREQSGLILQHQSKTVRDETISNNSNSSSSTTNGHGHRHFFAQQKKKFGFVDIALPLARRNKKKMQQQQ